MADISDEMQCVLDELRQRNHELELLQELSALVNRGIVTPDTTHSALALIRELLHAESLVVQVAPSTQRDSSLVGQLGFEPEITAPFSSTPFNRVPVREGDAAIVPANLLEYMALTKRILTTPDFSNLPFFASSLFAVLGYQSLLAFPIQVDNRVQGLALCASRAAHAFDEHVLQLAGTIAEQIGIGVRNFRALTDLKQRVIHMQVIARTGNWLQYAPRAEQALPRVIREIRDALQASYVVVHLLRGDHFEIVTASDARETLNIFPIHRYERELLSCETPLIVNNVDDDGVDPEQREILQSLGMRAAFAARLYAHERVLGLVFVNHETPREWTAQDQEWIQAFAHQIANALENKWLLDEMSLQVQELKTLGRVSRLIADAMPPDRALYAVAAQVARLFKVDYVGFQMRDGNYMRLVAESRELALTPLLPIFPHQYQILDELQPIRVTNVAIDAAHPVQYELLTKHGIVADLGVPLRAENKALGILYISHHTPREWTDAQVQLAETFGQQIASALKTAQLHSELSVQVKHLRTLAHSANMIARSRNPQLALPYAAQDLRSLLKVDYVGFHLLEGNELHIITEPQHGLTDVRYSIKAYHHPILYDFQRLVTNDRDVDAKSEMHRAVLSEYGYRADIAVPMVARGKTIGILFVNQKAARQWQENELALIETYAQHLAHVLENVQLLNEKEKRVGELTQLLELSELTTSIIHQEVLIEMALPSLANLLNADRTLAMIIQDGAIRSSHSSDGKLFPVQLPPLTKSLGELIEQRKPVLMDPAHPADVDEEYKERMKLHGAKALLLLPLVTVTETVGILSFVFQSEHLISQDEIRLAQSASNQLAMAIANARMVQTQQTRIERLTALADFGRWCGTVRDTQTLQSQAAKRICGLCHTQAASIRFVQGDTLTIGASAGYSHPQARAHVIFINPPLHRVLHQQKPYPISDLEKESGIPAHWRERQRAEGFRSLLLVPMLAENKVIGILTLFRHDIHTWTQDEIHFCQAVGNTLALALSTVEQIENVEHKSDELRATLDSVFSGVLTTDAEGVIQSWNRAAIDITGLPVEEMVGKRWDLEGPRVGTQKRDDNLIWEVMTERRTQFSYATRTFVCADGREIQLREAAAPLTDLNGQVRGVVCAFWNRTTELETERVKFDYMSLLGHQLGNKLGTILWGAEGLSSPALAPKSRAKYIRLIADSRRELEQFNQELEALQREHIHHALLDQRIELKKMLEQKIANWKFQHSERRFRLSGDFDQVLGDEMRLGVVIDNLLENACKYSPEGSLITVRGRLGSANDLQLTCRNRNAGEPLPSELQAQLFERGQRGNTAQAGRGLGLWLVRTKLHEMGGDISVASTKRNGTCFTVTLRRPVANPLSHVT